MQIFVTSKFSLLYTGIYFLLYVKKKIYIHTQRRWRGNVSWAIKCKLLFSHHYLKAHLHWHIFATSGALSGPNKTVAISVRFETWSAVYCRDCGTFCPKTRTRPASWWQLDECAVKSAVPVCTDTHSLAASLYIITHNPYAFRQACVCTYGLYP